MDFFQKLMGIVGTAIDALGVIIILAGTFLSIKKFFTTDPPGEESYLHFRQNVGKSILLGLEFLVAGDIIRTVVVSPTLDNVIVLGIIVLIRTFLSMALQLELEGKWPWQRANR